MSLNLIRASFREGRTALQFLDFIHLACFTNTNQPAVQLMPWMIHVTQCLDIFQCQRMKGWRREKMTRVDGMFGKKKLINILFFDFQMGFSTGLDYTCANSNHSRGLLFCMSCVCFTAGKMVISHFSVSITTLFPSGGLRWARNKMFKLLQLFLGLSRR